MSQFKGKVLLVINVASACGAPPPPRPCRWVLALHQGIGDCSMAGGPVLPPWRAGSRAVRTLCCPSRSSIRIYGTSSVALSPLFPRRLHPAVHRDGGAAEQVQQAGP